MVYEGHEFLAEEPDAEEEEAEGYEYKGLLKIHPDGISYTVWRQGLDRLRTALELTFPDYFKALVSGEVRTRLEKLLQQEEELCPSS